ncbi:MAG: O-antigen ligase family protein, partial [Anaerolineales bacterium]
RTTGFAFEPSWLAHQLNMLYIPYWFAASLQRYTAHPFRFLRLSVENLLLGGGVIVLVLSKSRVGWLAFLLILTLLLVKWTIALTRWIQTRALGRLSVKPPWKGALKFSLSAGLTTAFLCAYLASAIGLINLAGRYDQRLSRFFGRLEATDGFYQLTSRLAFAERAIYWGTGWEIFNDYPFLGVGLGNAGFFFPEKMPGFGNFLTEINDILFRRSFIPNTKSIWSRLLAETGILGFAFFVVWLYTLWQSARYVQANARPILRTVGLMGTFVLLGLLIEGFSVDSFALPYLWFSLGLLSAAASM